MVLRPCLYTTPAIWVCPRSGLAIFGVKNLALNIRDCASLCLSDETTKSNSCNLFEVHVLLLPIFTLLKRTFFIVKKHYLNQPEYASL